MQKNKILRRVIIYIAGAALLSVLPLAVPGAYALEAARGSLGSPVVEIMSAIAMFTTIMQALLFICLEMVGFLLQSTFFRDPAMMAVLHRIWVLSRDIMNLIFAVMLIGVALYTIIMANGDLVKSKIATFVAAVILVNFSWFFPRVIIDVSSILTATVFSIPGMITGGNCQVPNDLGGPPVECTVIQHIKIMPIDTQQYIDANYNCDSGLACFREVPFSAVGNTMPVSYAILNGLVVSFAKMHTLARVPASAAQLINSGQNSIVVSLQIMITIAMVFIIQIALLFPLLALTIGLLVRIIILWATMAFMPFAFLGLVINGKLGTDIFGFEDYIWKEFLAAAFLPTMVAVPISVGFIMLSSVAAIPRPAEFNLMLEAPLMYNISSWWSLMWLVAALVIIWLGAFAALSKSKITAGITNKIKGYGESLGKAALSLPLLAPIPLPGSNKSIPIGAALAAGKALPLIPQDHMNREGKKLLSDIIGDRGARAVDGDRSAVSTKLAEVNNENTKKIVDAVKGLKDGTGSRDTHLDSIRTALNAAGMNNLTDNKEVIPILKDIAEQSRSGGIADIKHDIQNLR